MMAEGEYLIGSLSLVGVLRRAREAGIPDAALRTSPWEYGCRLTVADTAPERVEALFAPLMVPENNAGPVNPAAELVRSASERGVSFGLAESCTGGLVGALVTAVAGSSKVFWGSMVTYANEAKERVLGVDTLERWGAVSEETVEAMNRGLLELSGAEAGVSVSGVAGPGGGSPEKPVGTVWFAFEAGSARRTLRCRFEGERETVRRRAAAAAVGILNGLILNPLLDIGWIAEYTFS